MLLKGMDFRGLAAASLAAVNYRAGFSQQVLRLRSECIVKEPAQHHLVGLQQHKAECASRAIVTAASAKGTRR